MRIAQVAPLYESVPPLLYGGTERIVSYLTEELVNQGHEVTLFASGDSVTTAELVACCPRSLRLDPQAIDHLAHHILMLEKIRQRNADFDVVHFHCDYLHYPLSRQVRTAQVTTLHGRLDLPDLVPLYQEFSDMPVVSISDAQRRPLPHIHWQSTVYHGIPPDQYKFNAQPQNYLAFLGRVSPEKGLDRAIEVAKQTGIELRIAAKVDRVDEQYFSETIKPILDHPLIRFEGEVGELEKGDFLGNALALLSLGDWPEPFGLVMIESMACGTPVIGFGSGSIPEVVDHGHSGFVVHSTEEAVQAVGRIRDIDRQGCRRTFERRFPASRMAQEYLAVYERLVRAEVRESDRWMTTSSG